jgi:hypothetical protein
LLPADYGYRAALQFLEIPLRRRASAKTFVLLPQNRRNFAPPLRRKLQARSHTLHLIQIRRVRVKPRNAGKILNQSDK